MRMGFKKVVRSAENMAACTAAHVVTLVEAEGTGVRPDVDPFLAFRFEAETTFRAISEPVRILHAMDVEIDDRVEVTIAYMALVIFVPSVDVLCRAQMVI